MSSAETTTQAATLATTLFELLRQMDQEATTVCNGHPTGLQDYGRHARPELRRPQNEPEWSKRLARLLTERGLPSAAEVKYPADPRKKCDVVVTLGPQQRLWIELKGAWRDYWQRQGSLYLYRSYLLHPLVEGLNDKSHTVPRDLEKLTRLSAPEAQQVAMLLIGFERPDDTMDGDVGDLVRLARERGLTDLETGWQAFTDRWDSAHVPSQTVRCWYWTRPT